MDPLKSIYRPSSSIPFSASPSATSSTPIFSIESSSSLEKKPISLPISTTLKNSLWRALFLLYSYARFLSSKIYQIVSFPFIFSWRCLVNSCRFILRMPKTESVFIEIETPIEEGIPQITESFLKKFPNKDPFRNLVFSSKIENKKSPFVHEERLRDCLQITTVFREGGFMHWWKNEKLLLDCEANLSTYPLHPLESLYFFFITEESTQGILNLKRISEEGGLRFYLRCAGYTQTPWELFVKKQKTKLTSVNASLLLPYLPGFCRALGLSKSEAEEKIKTENWDDFIVWILENRVDPA